MSQDVPKIARYVEGNVHLATLHAVACFQPKQTQPLRTETDGHPRSGGCAPRRAWQGLAGPAARGGGRERERAWCARRTGAQPDEWDRRAPLEVQQSDLAPAPLAERVAQQRPPAAKPDRARRRQLPAREAALPPRQPPRLPRTKGDEPMRRAAHPG